MDVSFEQKVREKAYEIWKAAGMAEGMADEHWLNAEKVVKCDSGKPVKAAAKTKSAAQKAPAAKAKVEAKAAPKTEAKAAPKATAKSSAAKH